MGKQDEVRILQKYSRKEIGDFVHGYCNLPFSFSLHQYAADCGLSIDAFKAMITVAISHCIVDDDAVTILEQKAVLAAYKHTDIQNLAVNSTQKQYASLKEKRKTFSFSDEEVIDLITKYAFSPLSKKDFCKMEAMTNFLFNKTLVKGITTCLVTDNIISTLLVKSILHTDDHLTVIDLYQKLLRARKKYKEEHETT